MLPWAGPNTIRNRYVIKHELDHLFSSMSWNRGYFLMYRYTVINQLYLSLAGENTSSIVLFSQSQKNVATN